MFGSILKDALKAKEINEKEKEDRINEAIAHQKELKKIGKTLEDEFHEQKKQAQVEEYSDKDNLNDYLESLKEPKERFNTKNTSNESSRKAIPENFKALNKKPDFVKWFSELDKDSGSVAGGKGANLAEIFNLKVPVPPGFVITAQAYEYFIEKAGIKEKIEELLDRINYEDTKELDEITLQIRTFITDSKMPKELEEEITDSYENLSADRTSMQQSPPMGLFRSTDPIFVAVRSSATTEDLAQASFAGQQDSFLNVKGKGELIRNVKKVFASLFTSRATYYRNKNGFAHVDAKIAVVVQKMINSDKSGVIFSKDPTSKSNNIIIEAVWGLGEGIVSGKITPDEYVVSPNIEIKSKKIANKKIAITRDSGGTEMTVKLREERAKQQVLKEGEIKRLADISLELEAHYNKPQDIEFAIESDEIYIVQTRPITTLSKRQNANEGRNISGEEILKGTPASPGIASGRVIIIKEMSDLENVKPGNVLVTKMTNPDMVVSMQRSSAIVTDEGGMTSHAAIVSREMGIPAIVGTEEATNILKEGELITVDGYTGKIYKGATNTNLQNEKVEIKPIQAHTKTKIKVIVDLPTFAERAAKSGATAVGLTRIEGIIAESGKHPEYFLKNNSINEYENIIYQGVSQIAKHFDEIWVRTSDIRSDEFSNLLGAPKEKEGNPMLGLHGIRYSLKKPQILLAELKALQRIANQGKTVGVMMPQLIMVEELRKVKEYLNQINFKNVKLGVMIETPAAVQIIKELCEEGIKFISFGTNDLTQYILAIDRNNPGVQDLYNEMNPAVLYQLSYVIRVCKRYNVETSICGQSGSRKDMAEFLVQNGIDSISVNADAAADIAEYVHELETRSVAGTDKEPRHFENIKNKNN